MDYKFEANFPNIQRQSKDHLKTLAFCKSCFHADITNLHNPNRGCRPFLLRLLSFFLSFFLSFLLSFFFLLNRNLILTPAANIDSVLIHSLLYCTATEDPSAALWVRREMPPLLAHSIYPILSNNVRCGGFLLSFAVGAKKPERPQFFNYRVAVSGEGARGMKGL